MVRIDCLEFFVFWLSFLGYKERFEDKGVIVASINLLLLFDILVYGGIENLVYMDSCFFLYLVYLVL